MSGDAVGIDIVIFSIGSGVECGGQLQVHASVFRNRDVIVTVALERFAV